MATKSLLFFCCFVCFLLCGQESRAQEASLDSIPITGEWESAGYIIDNAEMRVEIEYRLQKTSCDASGFANSNHLFRFKIEALKKPLGFDRYLSFKIMFEDCFGIKICKTVNLNVGIRQKNDNWDGIQPLGDPNLDNSFTGRRLIKAFYDVNLRWGKDATKDSECVLVETPRTIRAPQTTTKGSSSSTPIQSSGGPIIRVPDKPTYEMAKSIGVFSEYMNCSGSKVAFYTIGGKIDSKIKYHWTKSTCEGEQVGIGDTLVVSPFETTRYFVKQVGDSFTSSCISIEYKVKQMPTELPPFTKLVLTEAKGVRISIDRSKLIADLPVTWYKNSLSSSNRISSKAFTLEDIYFEPGDKYFYRFESSCDTTEATEVSFPEVKAAKKNSIYLGVGFVSGGNTAIQPINAMFGYGRIDKFKVYVRYKSTSSGTLGTLSPTLESSNEKITNYPVNTNTYYILSDKVATKRVSYSLGYMREFSRASIYVGAGLGNSQVYWNAQTYGYANPGLQLTDTWLRNMKQTSIGLEVEAGATVKIYKGFSGQLGINAINGASGMFITADFGVGFTF